MATLPVITISYPQTAVKSGTPLSGTLIFAYDAKKDILDAWVKVPTSANSKEWLKGEVQVDPGVVSEVGIGDISYLNFTRYRVPSRIQLKRFKARWLADLPYAASIIAGFFDTAPAPIRSHLVLIG